MKVAEVEFVKINFVVHATPEKRNLGQKIGFVPPQCDNVNGNERSLNFLQS